ncbi:MAG: hypothetical protein KatS3mg035_0872 [Bacteroidia bacterium]|nr:MAG: hypothetical protein KatS3mg035_0872 [Bacteroidia bacterium]
MNIIVIGAGPAGLTAAYQLSKHIGNKIQSIKLFEASDRVGGMSTSFHLWNQIVDLGPHRFFSNDKKVNQFWLEIVGNEYDMVHRLTRIYYNGKFFYYPLKAFNALFNLGIVEASQCIMSYLPNKLGLVQNNTNTFEGWVTQRFGKRLFDIFFKTYTEKLWGIPCSELDADFAAQRIKKLSLSEAILNAFRIIDNKKHKTLVDEFAYPLYGTGSVYEKMKNRYLNNGGQLFLKTPVKKVIIQNSQAKGIQLQNGEIHTADIVISSMPLSIMVEQLDNLPHDIYSHVQQLRYRNTILVYLNIPSENIFPDQWIYVHDNRVQTGRITNFRNWLPSLYGEEKSSILTLEYWCYDYDTIWNQEDNELIHLAKQELYLTGLVNRSIPIQEGKVIRLKNSYPVYFRNYKQVLEPIQEYLKTIPNLYPIGRYGSYKYNNQDHSILMGLLTTENILENSNHDLWSVNTDYENYQEKAIITKTGLKMED